MNKTFLMALVLASGVALAQSSGSSPGSMDQQQPSTQQNQPSSQSPASSGQSTMTGCLKGSDGSWVLVAEGQSTPVSGDSATLSPHNGHQVQLKGTPGSDGSFQVTEVVLIAESCPSPQSDASSGAAAAAAENAGDSVAGATKTVALDTSHAAQSAASDAAQEVHSKADPVPPDQTPPPQSTAPQTTPQTSTPQSTTPAAPAAGGAAPAEEQKKLPQTASPLPLLGLLGLGALVSGLAARRKK